MAEGGLPRDHFPWTEFTENLQDQQDEVMALESIYCDTDNLRVMNRPDENNSGLFHIEIDVVVPLQDSGILVQTWIPYEIESKLQSPEKIASSIQPGLRPTFKRSESGRRWHSTFLVSHLKPITLSVFLPQTYPSDGPPEFNLSALWLDVGQLSLLCEKLDHVWRDALGMPVLYNWIDLLHNETISSLALESHVTLVPYVNDGMAYDSRALAECQHVEDDLVSLILYAEKRQMEEFIKTDHECGVCFMEYAGRNFHRLDECKHHFCFDCLQEYCCMHVKDGTIQHLRCPGQECKCYISPPLLRRVLGDEAYVRWERLCLQKALETMEDMTWCPRCNTAVLSDQDGYQASCTECNYSFCPRCYEPFHGRGDCPSGEERLKELEKELKKTAEELGLDDDADEPALGTMSSPKAEAQARMRRLQAEYTSKQLIRKATKACPRCKARIEKYAGCNKVICTNCSTAMCWVCCKAIKGYEHFNATGASCALFPGQTENIAARHDYLANRPAPQGARDANDAIAAGRFDDTLKCPRCANRNLRNGRNNHLKCWACKSNICFQCKNIIKGLINAHFTALTPCNQHGD